MRLALAVVALLLAAPAAAGTYTVVDAAYPFALGRSCAVSVRVV